MEDEFDDKGEGFKKFMQRENADLKDSHRNLHKHIETIKNEQIEVEKFIHNQFDQLRLKREIM